MVSRDDLDERGVAAAGVPIAVLQPQRLAQPNARLRQQHPQQPVAHRPRHCRASAHPSSRTHHRSARSAPASAPAAPPGPGGAPGSPPAGGPCGGRRAPAAACSGRRRDAPSGSGPGPASTPLSYVIVVAGDHRPQPRGDRRLGEPCRAGARSRPPAGRPRCAARPGTRPKSSNVTASQSSPNTSRYCHHNASARA